MLVMPTRAKTTRKQLKIYTYALKLDLLSAEIFASNDPKTMEGVEWKCTKCMFIHLKWERKTNKKKKTPKYEYVCDCVWTSLRMILLIVQTDSPDKWNYFWLTQNNEDKIKMTNTQMIESNELQLRKWKEKLKYINHIRARRERERSGVWAHDLHRTHLYLKWNQIICKEYAYKIKRKFCIKWNWAKITMTEAIAKIRRNSLNGATTTIPTTTTKILKRIIRTEKKTHDQSRTETRG